jgi:signal peptidase I
MQVSPQAIQVITRVMQKHQLIELPANGTSMYPFMRDGDVCTFERCQPSELVKGDVILFSTVQGQLISHRFIKTIEIHGERYFICKGDTNLGFDEPILPEQIIGRLKYIKRKKTTYSSATWSSLIWAKVILLFPSLTNLLRKYIDRRAVRY